MIFTKKPKPKHPEQPPIKRSGSASWTDRLNDSVNQEGKETVLDERYAKKPIKTIEWY